MTPQQLNFDNQSNGRFETANDCPLCGEAMERGMIRGDVLVYECPACGHKERHTNLLRHDQDSSKDGISSDSFLGIGGDSLRKLLPCLLILFLSACQGPLHERRIQELERSVLQLSREVITLKLNTQNKHLPRRQELREYKAFDQFFVTAVGLLVDTVPKADNAWNGVP